MKTNGRTETMSFNTAGETKGRFSNTLNAGFMG